MLSGKSIDMVTAAVEAPWRDEVARLERLVGDYGEALEAQRVYAVALEGALGAIIMHPDSTDLVINIAGDALAKNPSPADSQRCGAVANPSGSDPRSLPKTPEAGAGSVGLGPHGHSYIPSADGTCLIEVRQRDSTAPEAPLTVSVPAPSRPHLAALLRARGDDVLLEEAADEIERLNGWLDSMAKIVLAGQPVIQPQMNSIEHAPDCRWVRAYGGPDSMAVRQCIVGVCPGCGANGLPDIRPEIGSIK